MNSLKLLKNKSIVSKYFKSGIYFVPRFYFADPMKSKEFAEEKFFFDKEEKKTLQNLLSKLNVERKEENEDDTSYLSRERLQTLLNSYNVKFSKELTEDLVRWKRGEKH